MSIKPILFNTEMVRAILDGRKTQTRRVVKLKYNNTQLEMRTDKYGTRLVEAEIMTEDHRVKKPDGTTIVKIRAIEDRIPPYKRGDILWVRETWGNLTECDVFPPYEPHEERFIYRADRGDPDHFQAKWHPSIHMPHEAARIFLRVKDVRVERLQDITEDDVCAEGAEPIIRCNRQHPVYDRNGVPVDMCWNTNSACKDCPEFKSYAELFGEDVWNETIKKSDMDKYGWSANPWVWVIEFERCEKPTDEDRAAAKWE